MELAPDPIRDYKLPFLKRYRISHLQNWPKKINLNIEVANIVFLEKSKLKVTSRIVLYESRRKFISIILTKKQWTS